jgi:small-conductance mechanosensitive channel
VSAEAREAGFVAALEGEGAVGIFVGAQDSAVTAVAGVLLSLDTRAFRGAVGD